MINPPKSSVLQDFFSQHPQVAGWFNLIKSGISFFTSGTVIIAFGHWLVSFCGRIAETAMLLAVLWITSVFIAPSFVLWGLGQFGGDLALLNTITDFGIMALALLPEVIVFNALVICIRFWYLAVTMKGQRLQYSAWAALHTMPTVAFLSMTVWTMWTFIHGHAHLDQATIIIIEETRSQGLTIRVFAGWFFCLTSVVYARLGKQVHGISATEETSTSQTTVQASEQPPAQQLAPQSSQPTALLSAPASEEATSSETETPETQEDHKSLMTDAPQAPEEDSLHSGSLLYPEVLQAYPLIQTQWLDQDLKSVTSLEVQQVTGLSAQWCTYHSTYTWNQTPANSGRYTIASVLQSLKKELTRSKPRKRKKSKASSETSIAPVTVESMAQEASEISSDQPLEAHTETLEALTPEAARGNGHQEPRDTLTLSAQEYEEVSTK